MQDGMGTCVWYNVGMKYQNIASLCLLLGFMFVPLLDVRAGLLLGRQDREKLERNKEVSKEVDGPWLMTYYVGYQNGYLKPKDVDYSLMTHIVVGGVGVRADGTLHEHWHLTNGDGRDMALEVGRRAEREGVKKLIWLGGPNEEDMFYAATANTNRGTLVKNILNLIEELDYDGVDIDWEPIRAKDEGHILRLVRDLRKADPDLIITVPINWVPSSILSTKDLSIYDDLAKYADRLFVMSYSMAGPWPGWRSWHGAALTGDTLSTPSSIKTSIYAYDRAGVPKEKLGIGIGTYATCWEYPVRRPEQTLPSTFYPRDTHVMSMRTMYDEYYSKRYEKWDSSARVPYLSFMRPKGELNCGFISYENERSIEYKMEYMEDRDYGGAIVWNIGTGYFTDESRSKRHKLLKSAYDALE